MWTSQEFYSHFHLFLVLFALFLAVWLIRIVNEEFGTRPWVRFFQDILFKNCLIFLKVGFLLQFHWSLLYRSSFSQVRLQIIIMGFFCMHAFIKTFSWIPQALSYLRQLVLWCWLRFRMGCLMFECESFIIYHWPTHLNFYLDLGRRFIHSWSWSTKQKTFHCRKAHSYLRVSAAFISSINTETSSIDCNKPLIARSCIIQINVPSAFELIFSAFSIRPDAQAFVL